MMKEKDAQVLFGKWIRDNKYDKTAAFELKLCHSNNALAFNAFQPQQIPCLLQAKNGSLYKKLSDADPTLKPFDCFNIANAEAYVIAIWKHDKKPAVAYWIDVEDFINAQKLSTRKSMTEFIASKLASKIIHL